MQTGFFHHVGTFLLFISFILLLLTTITAPVIGPMGILKVALANYTDSDFSAVTFGTFGYCVLNVPPVNTVQNWCTSRSVGYEPASVMATIDGPSFSTASNNTANGLTRVMILHPIACALAFIAFLLAFGSGVCGSLLGALVAGVAWVVSVIALAADLVSFGLIRNNVNNDTSGSYAYYSVGMWTTLAAMVCLFFATFIVFFTCCSARLHRRLGPGKADNSYAPPAAARWRLWQRRGAY